MKSALEIFNYNLDRLCKRKCINREEVFDPRDRIPNDVELDRICQMLPCSLTSLFIVPHDLDEHQTQVNITLVLSVPAGCRTNPEQDYEAIAGWIAETCNNWEEDPIVDSIYEERLLNEVHK